MGQLLVGWLLSSPNTEGMDLTTWYGFLDVVAGWLVAQVILFAFLIILLYSITVRKWKIHSMEQLYGPYTPIGWLWLSLCTLVGMVVVYSVEYGERWTVDSFFTLIGPGVLVGVWGSLLTFLVAYVVMLTPLATPVQYRFRPLPHFFFRVFFKRALKQS